MKTIKIGIIGAGRIGRVHAENIAKFVPEMEIKTIADPYMSEETVEFLRRLRIPNIVKDADVILNDPEIKAVVVCSPTDLHAEYAIKVAEAGKDVFVEKPVDYRIDRVKEVIAAAKKAGVKLQVGFNRRFDHNHRAVYEAIRAGKVGKVNLVKISSRDPEPPTIDYVKVSGGIFYDMMVHDFDMARFLAGSEVTEVFAYGAVLVDPAIGEAGDVDTAVVSLKFANGAMGVIDNSRKAVYGYDQRVEVFGSEGAVMDENDTPNNATYYGADGTSSSPCYKIMWDRYTMAFAAEQRAFAEAVINGTETAREVVSSVTLKEPVAERQARGTKERPTWFPTGSFRWPCYGVITSYFGGRNTGISGASSYHEAIDIANSYGTPIYAADGGTVIYSGWNGGLGYCVKIDHGNGFITWYGHNSDLYVSVGDHVYKGQTIAAMGSTGISSGSHCDFRIQRNGTMVDPLNYLP